MARVVCLTYTAGEFAGVKFHEEVVDGVHVGVGETSDRKALAWFRARPGTFRVEGGGGKGAGKGDQQPPADPPAGDESKGDDQQPAGAGKGDQPPADDDGEQKGE